MEDSQTRTIGGRTPIVRELFPRAAIEYYGVFGGSAKKNLMEDAIHTIEGLKNESNFKYNLVIGPRNCEQLLFYQELMA